MTTVFIYAIIAIILFVAAFITKRRFGLLGLALAAGSILNGIWAYDAGLVAGLFGVPSTFLTSAIVSVIVILLPAIVLLFHGSTYRTLLGRIIGASLFTVLAISFMIEPLSHALIVQGVGSDIYTGLLSARANIIGVGLIVAIIDLFLTKPAHFSGKHHKR
ncbi:MAG: hypothetical protein WCK26_03735 [Candidatus Saccharibacteria bacterium]